MRHDWINKALPGVGVARGYKRSWLKSVLVAGAALSAALVPAWMAYGASARFTADHFFPTLRNAVHSYKSVTGAE